MSFTFNKFKIYLRDSVLPAFMFRWRARLNRVPEANLYRPHYHPWRDKKSVFYKSYRKISRHTLISQEAAWILYSLASQAFHLSGDFIEVGVYKGGSARFLWQILKTHQTKAELYLFDTFTGMPKTNKHKDLHHENDFDDTSVEAVSTLIGHDQKIHYLQGLIEQSFKNFPTHISFVFAHIDMDIYDSILTACNHIYPRMKAGGVMVFDDYGAPSCPGARAAVDEFFLDKPENPLILSTGQAIVYIISGNPKE